MEPGLGAVSGAAAGVRGLGAGGVERLGSGGGTYHVDGNNWVESCRLLYVTIIRHELHRLFWFGKVVLIAIDRRPAETSRFEIEFNADHSVALISRRYEHRAGLIALAHAFLTLLGLQRPTTDGIVNLRSKSAKFSVGGRFVGRSK